MKDYYSPADFLKSPKYDAHIHYHTFDDRFVRKAEKANLHLIAINTDFDFLPLEKQYEISKNLHQRHPQTFNFIGTFDATTFASDTFAEDSVKHIKDCMAAGAKGVKIWKNIGMALKNEAGQNVMADDPVFTPIFAFLEKEKIPLLAHLGEPRNCWLPIDRMNNSIDRKYFGENPNYHMYLHSGEPSYERHIAIQDRIPEHYPELIFVGAHLGSMEWNLEEVAKRLERFPNFYVDLSVKFEHLYEQTIRNRKAVVDFFETYRDRILYGSDYFVTQYNKRKWMNLICKYCPQIYMSLIFKSLSGIIKKNWLFLATDEEIDTGGISGNPEMPWCIKGLQLTKKTVDRIFYENVRSVYFNKTSP